MIKWRKLYRPKIIKVFIYLIPVFIFIWLLGKHFVVLGKIESSYGFGLFPSIITELSPTERVENPEKDLKTKEICQRITGEPIYFGVKIPRMFKKIKLDLTYSAPSQPIIELGVKKSAEEMGYEFQTIQNRFLDGIEKGWKKIEDEEKELVLLQKGIFSMGDQRIDSTEYIYNYDRISDFLDNLPKDKVVANYKFDLFDYLKLENYKKSKEITEINHYLRGSHEINTYIKDEDLDFTFSFYDINISEGPDNFNVNVYQGENKIFSYIVEDDGNEEANSITSPLREYQLHLPNLEEGKYKIELDVNDDFMIKQIKTRQKYIVFADRLFLAGNEEYQDEIPGIDTRATSVYAQGSAFAMRVFHPSSSQVIKINNKNIPLNAEDGEYTRVLFDDFEVADLKKIHSPKNDLLVGGDYFVFDESHYFDPSFGFKLVPLQEVRNINDLDYIIAYVDEYISPKQTGKWARKKIEFDVSQVHIENNTVPFIISLPNINGRDTILIKEIRVILEKDPLWKNFFPRLKNYLSRKL
jgi:hypothetical protein